MKQSLAHSISVARQQITNPVAGVAAISGFQLYSTDITQAYLYGPEKLLRGVYLNPPKENNLKPNQLIQLLKPLYRLAESGDY